MELFVAPAGKDDNPGTKERPFATVNKALAVLRAKQHKNQDDMRRSCVITLRGGVYTLTEPLEVTPADAGPAEQAASLTIRAMPGEQPILSGGRPITGWQETTITGKKLWTVTLPEVRAGRWYFHQLWINDQRRPRARHPNQGFLKIAGLPDVTAKTPYNEGQQRFQYAANDLHNWDHLQDADIVVLHLWVGVRLAVDKLNEKDRLVYFQQKSHRRLTEGSEPARYYVENALEFLDAPGEWYLNRHTGQLYYWPLPGETIAETVAIAPALPYLLRLSGDASKKRWIDNVTLERLAFLHAEWWPERKDPVDTQAAVTVPAAIQINGARHCRLIGCTVAHVGNYGIHCERGCQHNEISGCHVYDAGAGGIRLGETVMRSEKEQQTYHNTVAECHIEQTGRIFPQAVGVWIGQSYQNQVRKNHIHDLYYTGISCGWTWGYGPTLARDNIIEYNHVHDVGQGMLSDMGGIYTLGVQPGTVVRHNHFHDIAAYKYGGWGIYFDEGSTQIKAQHNLVYRTTHGGFHQHYGKENVVDHNIFALGRDAQIRRSRLEPHLSFHFTNNVVYWNSGKLLDGSWNKLNVEFDRNLYWQADEKPIRFAHWSWAEWQKLGMDRHSQIANPLFQNPQQMDFRFQQNSPALKMGFAPQPVPEVGPGQELPPITISRAALAHSK